MAHRPGTIISRIPGFEKGLQTRVPFVDLHAVDLRAGETQTELLFSRQGIAAHRARVVLPLRPMPTSSRSADAELVTRSSSASESQRVYCRTYASAAQIVGVSLSSFFV